MTDTISAIATATGNAALGIIRISGPDAKAVLRRIVPGATAHRFPRKIRYGKAVDVDTGTLIDDVLCFYSPGPNTATGEDTAEIHGHGGMLVLNRLLQQTFNAGARLAEPGEFTRRAYTNGRMDLTQAEAVMALIGAKSERAAQTAARQLNGSIGRELAAEYEQVTTIAAALETCLDFPDEDLPDEQNAEFVSQLDDVCEKLTHAVQSYRMGQLLTKGAKVVIAGPSNAGKSSLLNALIREDKALVDSVPGTTRDIVEASYEIDGIPITFLDTAGLRFGAQKVEQMGMAKSKQAIDTADLILIVLDGAEELEIQSDIQQILDANAGRTVIVLNKSDKATFSAKRFSFIDQPVVSISVQKHHNLEALQHQMRNYLVSEQVSPDLILTTARQLNAVETALTHTKTAMRTLAENGEPELAAADIRWAREALAGLWGKHAMTDVIDTIFSSFCLGK
ncbi:MAG: tRNA uridine-5-carboxymethylaminomethyl(34) synthesis GTPase MnmE [Deltaproteobacteria bacterium]|nr:tRNA uridine-5-carboxymethylaminomethyl(34) synthesis GTPase MnmE [Deltaproteobacteria bacterium]MBN2674064.1 tRNA uridine-5-carboxymethylaminomethyl(34) synthesis GTPase MnmE [Deltaproteobacteria bacterium]